MSAQRNYWLMKSEPDVFSIDDLAAVQSEPWDGIRNYQARNFMRQMKVDDWVIIYHSNAKPPGVAGLARVTKTAYPDHTQFEPESKYFDPKSPAAAPRWDMVDVAFVEKFPQYVPLNDLKAAPELEGMLVIRKGSRLSVQPVEPEHVAAVLRMAAAATKPPT